MSRRYLAFVIGINAIISLAITLLALWLVELRRPDPEQLASIITPRPQVILASTPVPVITPEPQTQAAIQLPTPTPRPAPVLGEPYTVKAGDSLSSIATRFDVSLNDLLETNNLENPDFVFVGQRIYLPEGAREIPQTANQSTTQDAGTQNGAQAADTAPVQGLKITQVAGSTNIDAEVLQVINDSDSPLNLQGWRITYEGGPVYTFGNFPIFPGGSVRLNSGSGTNTSIDLYWGQSTAVWQPQRTAQLIDNQGRLVHQYTIP